MRRIGLVGIVGAAAFVGLAVPAAAEDSAGAEASGGQCIPQSARRAASSCEQGPRRQLDRSGAAPRSRFRETKREVETPQSSGATAPGIEIDTRLATGREEMEQRSRQLLEREIRILQRLVRNTRQNNPQRPEILLRLAETYFEMQSTVNAEVRSYDEPIFQHCTQQRNRERCQRARQGQQQAQERLDEVRQAANQTYAILVRDHPDFPRMDQVLFSLAFGLEQLRQHEQSRMVYRRLIKNFPESRFIPHAYLSFAEFFFNEGDMRPALQFYQKVVEFPPERNPVYGYALYKSAWAQYNLEDFRGSLQSFVEVIDFGSNNPNAADAENLVRQSRRELVMPYARVGSPNRALAFFQRYAPDRETALDMLESLAELYYDGGDWDNAIATYHNLMAEAPQSNKLCYWQSRVTNAVISSQSKPRQVEELQRLTALYQRYVGEDHPVADKRQCEAETAEILVWLATSWHREAVGTDDSPGTNDRQTMGQAAELYTLLLEQFPHMEELEFPNINREDWPTHYRIAYFQAELLWKMEDWERCGPAFDRVVNLNPQGEFTSDAAYAAVLCYNNLYQSEYQDREREARTDEDEDLDEDDPARFARREMTELERGMLGAFTRYICVVDEGAEDLVQIKYRKARIFYESNHFEEAAVIFRDIAWNHAESEYGEFAANLYLDSLNVLGTMQEPNRPECIVELTDNIDPLAERFCASASDRELHPDLCSVVGELQCQATRAHAESLQSTERYREAAAKYVEMFRANLQRPEEERCGAMDEILWNAAINYEAARLLGRAIRVRQALIQEYPESEWSKRSVYLLGANFHALAYYERAAGYYEQFARQYAGETGEDCSAEEREEGRCPDAVLALRNATLFRLGLGQHEEALEDIELFTDNYKRSRPAETAQVAFAIGPLYERLEWHDHVIRYYRRFLRSFRRQVAPHQQIMAHVMMGRAFAATEEPRDATRAYQSAVRVWERGAPRRIAAMDGTEAEKFRYLRDAIDHTAEAMFRLAEDKYQAFRRVDFPTYRGGRSLERVNRWAENEFASWVQEKLRALRAAEEEYNAIASLEVVVREGVEPLKSPPWQIAAAARSGMMYREFVDHFRDAPIPTVIENDPELYNIYAGALDEQSQPLLDTATQRFLFCLRTATNVRWFNEWSSQCEQELNRLNPTEYPMAAELRGEPNYIHGTPARPGAIELGTGEEEMTLGSAGSSESQGGSEGGGESE